MLVLAVALLGGLACGFACGGKLANLANVRLRLAWLVLVALGLQIVAFSALGEHLGSDAVIALHLTSYVVLLGFAILNLRYLGIKIATVGIACNALAIAVNGGFMPATRRALVTAGRLYVGDTANNSRLAENAHLLFLGDIFALPHWLPLANVFSVGDIGVALGVAAFIVSALRAAPSQGSALGGRAATTSRHALTIHRDA